MATITGIVTSLQFDRENGKVELRDELGGGLKTFHLYADTGVSMIDPTEMVRRNWIFGLLQRAVTHGLCVTVIHSQDAFVQGVTLQNRYVGLGGTDTTKGKVLEISLLPVEGTVTIRVPNPKYKPQSTPGGPPAYFDRVFNLYLDASIYGATHGLVESAHRNRVINLLQQALADDLPVTLSHSTVDPENSFVAGAILHHKE